MEPKLGGGRERKMETEKEREREREERLAAVILLGCVNSPG